MNAPPGALCAEGCHPSPPVALKMECNAPSNPTPNPALFSVAVFSGTNSKCDQGAWMATGEVKTESCIPSNLLFDAEHGRRSLVPEVFAPLAKRQGNNPNSFIINCQGGVANVKFFSDSNCATSITLPAPALKDGECTVMPGQPNGYTVKSYCPGSGPLNFLTNKTAIIAGSVVAALVLIGIVVDVVVVVRRRRAKQYQAPVDVLPINGMEDDDFLDEGDIN